MINMHASCILNGILGTLVVFCRWTSAAPSITGNKREQPHNEFQLNQGVCPPVLCPQIAGALAAGVAMDPSSGGASAGAPLLFVAPPQAKAFESPFFEGDIVLDEGTKRRLTSFGSQSSSRVSRSRGHGRRRQQRSRARRAIAQPLDLLWPFGKVPYVIDSGFSPDTMQAIEQALDDISRKTCIQFIPRTGEKDYLFYINQPGCWSYVGRQQKGAQYVSIGRGCEKVGTIMHETGHALGFWHEQSRPDRDTYVKVKKKNMAPSVYSQFDKRANNESWSRGFAYDYESIMHYGKNYFSSNGRHTLKVIGPGVKHKFRIGQRNKLSDLDLAQLRAMYYCNSKDRARQIEQLVCHSGWTLHGESCYRFHPRARKDYAGAMRLCQRARGHLLYLETAGEDNFIKDYLIKNYNSTRVWRTGGKLERGKFVWHNPTGRDHEDMTYTEWAPNHPGPGQSTMGLVLYDGGYPQRYVWRGLFAGSTVELPKYTYAVICEQPAHHRGRKCTKTKNPALKGQDYRGKIDYTAKNVTCMRWTEQYPHSHNTMTGDKKIDRDENGLGDHNYCRNPNGERAKPWCYVPLTDKKWQYCDINICKK